MNSYAVAEKFVSINGEGKHAGELAVFLRFRGWRAAFAIPSGQILPQLRQCG